MESDFAGKTAIVTGAAHGLGRAIVLGLVQRGATVYAIDVLAEELTETQRVAGGDAHCTVAEVDVTDEQGVQQLGARVRAERGAVHILVNCAGGVRGQVGRPIEEVTMADWDTIVRANLTSAFLLTRTVTPLMKEQRYGRIVNISSGAGRTVSLTGIQAYASAKAGQIGFTRQSAHELGPWGITVNNVSPGFVRSNPSTERQWQSYGPERQKALIDGIPLRRLGAPEDIANAVLFFASDAAGWITGQTLSVDGGSTMI
ncbi:MAG: short-chain dehydrogenase [Chloroflexi bacterium]|jgi:3-oxoacyl-[acyl-carrier protein] reductase|nr:short-chain dehydrogenase [Chloroflexota bacterium]